MFLFSNNVNKTLKRVPLDFQWPIGESWEGYINPYSITSPCPHCKNGYSSDYTRLESLWYAHLGGGFSPLMRGSEPYLPNNPAIQRRARRNLQLDPEEQFPSESLKGRALLNEALRLCNHYNQSWSHHLDADDVAALLKEDRLTDLTTTFVEGKGRVPKEPGYVPTPQEVNDWSLDGFGHDSCNAYIVISARLKRHGLPVACPFCEGDCVVWDDPEDKARCKAWRPEKLPMGDGFQLWERKAEAAPLSPVFASLDELAEWCESGVTTFQNRRASAADWKRLLTKGSV